MIRIQITRMIFLVGALALPVAIGCSPENATPTGGGSDSPGGLDPAAPEIAAPKIRQALQLDLSAEKTVFDRKEAINVMVTLSNRDERYWVVFPLFSAPGKRPPGFPVAELGLTVTDETGSRVTPMSWIVDYASVKASPHTFLILLPGSIYGRRVALTERPFNYQLTQPGTYEVQAHLTLNATHWIKNTLQAREIDEGELLFDLERVFDGFLESNVITIQIGEPLAEN